eukprot:1311476-Pleurochrysis_carterae.AAC.2
MRRIERIRAREGTVKSARTRASAQECARARESACESACPDARRHTRRVHLPLAAEAGARPRRAIALRVALDRGGGGDARTDARAEQRASENREARRLADVACAGVMRAAEAALATPTGCAQGVRRTHNTQPHGDTGPPRLPHGLHLQPSRLA